MIVEVETPAPCRVLGVNFVGRFRRVSKPSQRPVVTRLDVEQSRVGIEGAPTPVRPADRTRYRIALRQDE